MEKFDRFCDVTEKAFDALYRPMVIVLLCLISHQLGQLIG